MADFVMGLRLVGGVFLILANGFFVAIEFALTRVRQYSKEEFDEPGLRKPWEMTEQLEIYLTSCQVGITASSIAVGIVAEPALVELLSPFVSGIGGASSHLLAGGIAFIIINLVHLTHGEQTPTYLGVERTKTVTRYGAPLLYWFTWAIMPLIRLGDTVAKWTLKLFGITISRSWTDEEGEEIETRAALRSRVTDTLSQSELTEEREAEVLAALEIGEMPVREIMVEREDIVPLSTENDPDENLRVMDDHPHVRFPLVGESLEDFRGVVYTPAVVRRADDLRDGSLSWEEVAAEPMTLAPNVTVSDAIDQFQAHKQELALVLEDGEVVGLLTPTDAFEAVMGDLQDPLDAGTTTEATL